MMRCVNECVSAVFILDVNELFQKVLFKLLSLRFYLILTKLMNQFLLAFATNVQRGLAEINPLSLPIMQNYEPNSDLREVKLCVLATSALMGE